MKESSKLYIDNIFSYESDSPSSVRIQVMNPGKDINSNLNLVGLMVGDPTFSVQNSWGNILNDVSNLQDWNSLMGSESMFSWINASTMCWKGTSPLNIGIEFMLVNYRQGLNLEEGLREFVKLASLYKDRDAWLDSAYKVKVHAGYAADILSSNAGLWTSDSLNFNALLGGDAQKGIEADRAFYNPAGGIAGFAQGTVALSFGHKSQIRNLLLSRANVTESTVEVADKNGGNRKPLYYRVSAQFTGVRPLVTSDVDAIYGWRRE